MSTPDSGYDAPATLSWQRWGGELCDALSALTREVQLSVRSTDSVLHRTGNFDGYRLPGPDRLLGFRLMSSGRLRCTITSFVYAKLSEEVYRSLYDSGFRRLSRNRDLCFEVHRDDVADLAELAGRVLRDLLEVPDPESLTIAEVAVPQQRSRRNGRPAVEPTTVPGSGEQLLRAAAEAITRQTGEPTEIHDGFIHLGSQSGLHSNLMASQSGLALECVAVLSPEIPDMAILGAVIAEHSVRWPEISIVATKSMVFAVYTMTASAFHPRNLRTALSAWERFLCDGAIDIAEQLYPGSEAALGCGRPLVPRQLGALLDLHLDRPETVTPGYLVEVTRANAPMLRRYLRICRTVVSAYDAAAGEGGAPPDPERGGVTELGRDVCDTFIPVLAEAVALAAEANANR